MTNKHLLDNVDVLVPGIFSLTHSLTHLDHVDVPVPSMYTNTHTDTYKVCTQDTRTQTRHTRVDVLVPPECTLSQTQTNKQDTHIQDTRPHSVYACIYAERCMRFSRRVCVWGGGVPDNVLVCYLIIHTHVRARSFFPALFHTHTDTHTRVHALTCSARAGSLARERHDASTDAHALTHVRSEMHACSHARVVAARCTRASERERRSRVSHSVLP